MNTAILIAFGIGAVIALIAFPWRRKRGNDKCAYCGLPVPDDGYVCPCVPTITRAANPISKLHLDPIDNNSLYFEWCDGPGKDYPSHIKMMRATEGAPLEPIRIKDDGWDTAFYKWVAERNTKPETRNYPFPAPPIPDAVRNAAIDETLSTDELITKYNLRIIQYNDPCEPEVNCTMYCALPPGKHFDHWPKSGGLEYAVKIAVEKIAAEGIDPNADPTKIHVTLTMRNKLTLGGTTNDQ